MPAEQLSPVLQAFFQGYRQQSDNLQQAQAWQLRREQLDEAIKQFETEMKMREKEHKLHMSQLDLTTKKYMSDALENYKAGILSGVIKLPGITGPAGGSTMKQDYSLPISDPSKGLDRSQLDFIMNRKFDWEPGGGEVKSSPFSDQVIDTPFGSMVMSGLRSKEEIDEEDFQDFTRKETARADIIYNKKYAQDEMKWENALIRERETNATKLLIAEMRGWFNAYSTLMKLGLKQPAMEEVAKTARAVATGDLDLASIPTANEYKANVERYLVGQKWAAPPKGAQWKQDTMSGLSPAFGILNEFKIMQKNYPPPKNLTGQVGQGVETLPFINKFTDIGQAYENYKARILSLSQLLAEKLGRVSNKDMEFIQSLNPRAMLNPKRFTDLKLAPFRMYFEAVQGKLNSLSSDQQRMLWEQIIEQNKDDFVNDGDLMQVIMQIKKSGRYSPSFMNFQRQGPK